MDLEQPLSDDSSHKVDHLNYLLTQKIGYGPAQQKLSRSLYLLLFSEGCESIVLGLLLPILTDQWNLSTFQQSMLITVVYLGVSIGSYLQIYADKYGRHAFITCDAALQSFFGLFSCLCWSYQSFLFARFFYGVGIGICLPLSASYITQISPASMRATLLAKSRVYWSAGCLVTCFLGWYFLQTNSWRTLLFVICVPGMYAMYQHKTHGKQSLRYLWVQKKIDDVQEITTLMCTLNGKSPINRAQLNSLINEDAQQSQQVTISRFQMFSPKYKASSIRLISSWFSVCFIYYGVMLLLPTILQRVFAKTHGNQNFKYMFIVAISVVQVASFYLSSKVMDHPKIGRKKAVYYGFIIVLMVTMVIILLGQDNKMALFVIFVIIKFVITATFMTLYPYTAQIYETMIRGKALGICSMSGRIATTFLGIVGVYAMKWFDGNGLYLIFVLLCALSGYGAYTMPFCTGNRPIG